MSELHEVEMEYGRGKYGAVERDLETFVVQHRQDILRYRDVLSRTMKTPVTDELAVKWYILSLRTINPGTEIRDQLREIEAECWIRGENHGAPVPREDIAREWCRRHAPGWRDHRVMVVVYCFQRNKERYLSLLREPVPVTP